MKYFSIALILTAVLVFAFASTGGRPSADGGEFSAVMSASAATYFRSRAVPVPVSPSPFRSRPSRPAGCVMRNDLVRNCDVDQYADASDILSACVTQKSAWIFCDSGSCAVAFFEDAGKNRYTSVYSVLTDAAGNPIVRAPRYCEFY